MCCGFFIIHGGMFFARLRFSLKAFFACVLFQMNKPCVLFSSPKCLVNDVNMTLADLEAILGVPSSVNPSANTSPVLNRKDSILKHSGSVKSEKRVSIKNNSNLAPNSFLEFISEKCTNSNSGKPPSGNVNQLIIFETH